MGAQTSRLWFRGSDHKDIYYQGKYHDEMYIGDTLVWKKDKNMEGFKFSTPRSSIIFMILGNVTINWGDGYENSYSYEELSTVSHGFLAASDRHVVTIYGDLLEISFSYRIGTSGGTSYVEEIITPFPKSLRKLPTFKATGLKKIPEDLFKNLRNLTYIGAVFAETELEEIPDRLFSGMINLKRIDSCFRGCHQLVGIPEKIFNGLINLEELRYCFEACENITQIPENLFSGLLNIIYISGVFKDCSGITEIPRGLFYGNINPLNISCFSGTCITEIPEDLFFNCKKLVSVLGCFSHTLIKTIPENLFLNCNDLIQAELAFSECFELTTIPGKLFSGCNKLIYLSKAFYYCTSLKSIPPDFFDFDTESKNAEYTETFFGCSGITGTIPDIWNGRDADKGRKCFYGCVNAANYAEIPKTWVYG